MTTGIGSSPSPPRSKLNLGTILDKLPLAVVALMLTCAVFLFSKSGEVTVRSERSPLEGVSAIKLLFFPFTQGQRWLLTLAYFVDPWASDRAAVGDLVPAAAIAESSELAGLVGRQIEQRALYVARETSGTPPGTFAAVWFADLKASDLPVPIDVRSRESISAFLNNFGASAVIFPIVTSPLTGRWFDRVVTWGRQVHYIAGAPAESPPPLIPQRSPT